MIIKALVDEDFVNYKVPTMYIGTAQCDGKCCREAGIPLSVCQNDEWRKRATIDMADRKIINRYLQNPITKAICFAGLEPFEQFDELLRLIRTLRLEYQCDDPVVIYTGFNRDEIEAEITKLAELKNIIVKFGRYVPNQEPRYDEVLGVTLASPNQYAEVIG